MLAKGFFRSAVQMLVATDLLCSTEDLGHLYFVTNGSYWAKAFLFEARVGDRQGLCAGWPHVELFSLRVSDCAKYYCYVPTRWPQYKVSILMFMLTPIILGFHSGFVQRGSADD